MAPMEADWDEITRIAVPSAGGPLSLPSPAAAVAFDDIQELLWIGTDQVSPLQIPMVSIADPSGAGYIVSWT